MNFLTLQSRVVDYLDRTDLTTKIQNWINDARKDIALKKKFDYLYEEATCSTSAGSARYALPADYLGHLVVWCGQKKLSRILPREADELTQSDIDADSISLYLEVESGSTVLVNDTGYAPPDYYIDRGMEIELYPTPDDVYTLTLKYYAQPEDFTVNADYDFISTFHFEAIIWGAAWRGAMYLDDEVKKVTYKENYYNAIGEMIQKDQENKLADTRVRFKTYRDYDLTTFKRLTKVKTVA